MKSELFSQWEGFIPGKWCEAIDVREFIQKNYTPYIGDEKFLAKLSDKTCRLKSALDAKLEEEKAQIEAALCSGTLSVDELTEKSKRLPELNDLIDEKTMRWLELSEIEG